MPLIDQNKGDEIDTAGSVDAFVSNWKNLSPDSRYFFSKGQAENQVQFAFQNHWRVFREILGGKTSGKVLEVGCGRGSMAAFFANQGYETFLLDTAHYALSLARDNFNKDGLKGYPIQGNALLIPHPNESFDVIFSIGLLEHFVEIRSVITEQLRVLKRGGYFLGYVVPERPFSVQTLAQPVNTFLRIEHVLKGGKTSGDSKSSLFRNANNADDYINALCELNVQESGSTGIFPVPLISHSPRFPFSLMSPRREKKLVKLWRILLTLRGRFFKEPWTCSESWGLAFLVWAKK